MGIILGLGLALGLDTGGAAAEAPDPATAVAPADPTLEGRIDAVLADPTFASAKVGVSVIDLADGSVLYARGQKAALNPASNVKLVTSASALALLGPEYRYATRIYVGRDRLAGGVVRGDLYLRGSGDPSLVTEGIYDLAGDLRARGVTRVTGGIVVDNSRFDRDELPPGFDQKEELASYRAPSGAASVNFNTFVLRVAPGSVLEAQPGVAVDPPAAGIRVDNRAKTAEGYRRRLYVDVKHDAKGKRPSTVTLRGTIGIDAGPAAYRYPVANPSRHAGEVLAVVLKQRGIRIGRARIKMGTVPSGAQPVGLHHSAPLSVLIRGINKLSNNFMAEQVLKTMADPAEPATFAGALERVRTHLAQLGVDTAGMRLGNGSGLYDTNRISAAQFTALLAAVERDLRIRPDFMASLAIMGVDGTVRSRLRESTARRWVRGKTGTLDGVSALSGYVGAKGRRPIAFSILFNDLPRGNTPKAREAQDRIAELISRHAAGQPLVDPPAVVPE